LGWRFADRRSVRENGRMRPGNQSNKRMRGRGRKGPNPLTRTYESNGPDVKIRGTAQHIAEKYQQLARDAQASGDRIMSENYLQHAEHYLRIIAAAQPPVVQQNARPDQEDGAEGQQNGAAPTLNGDQPRGDQSPASGPVVDEDSPQPFIESMPTIDAAGQVNGPANGADGQADDGEEEKPRRRARTPRPRAPKRVAAEQADAETSDANGPADGEGAVDASSESGEDEKPKPRRAPRARRPKKTEAADTDAVAAGE